MIVAVNSVATSSAYYLAFQASEMGVTPSGRVGSIGAVLMHLDVSEAMARAGEKVTVVTAGERKLATHEYAPLSQLGREEMEASVGDYYKKFVAAVARGRNATQTQVREGFGKGGMVRAEQALKEGMADRVGTLEQVLGRFGVNIADAAPAATASAQDVEIRRRRMKLGRS